MRSMAPLQSAEAIRAYVRWTRAAGPFWAYAGLTPLCGSAPLDTSRHADVTALVDLSRRVLEAQILPLLPESGQKLALILDLPIRISLACALPLAEAGFIPVPLVYRWPVEPSNVDASEAAALLASLAPSPRGPTDPRGVALLLDSQRYDGTSRFSPGHFDGRYHYPLDVLPPPQALLDWGATAVVTVSDRVQIRDDLATITERYARSGLQRADIWVDLAAVAAHGAEGR